MSLPSNIEDQYQVLGRLGAGGMGAVYRVRHRLLNEVRVVKVMQGPHAETEHAQLRFHGEAQAAIRLRHPNVAQVYDFWIDQDGTAALVMEYIDGFTLKGLLQGSQPPPLSLVVEVARQGLEALGYLHRQGYLHRDVAPDNLMLTEGLEGAVVVKLIDLGLAKELVGSQDLTATGTFVGKVRYASPEQFRGREAPLDERSDLYSFGVVLYELLTGICPIRGGSFEELLAAKLLQPVPGFDETDPAGRVPNKLRRAIMGSLEREPEKRVPTARVFAQQIGKVKAGAPPTFATTRAMVVDQIEHQEPHQASPSMGVGSTVLAGPGARVRLPSPGKLLRRINFGLPKLVAGLVVTTLVIAGFFGVRWQMAKDQQQPVAPTGRVLIDASAWAEVTKITSESGDPVAFEGKLVTPFSLSLPAGSYELTFEHPNQQQAWVETLNVTGEAAQREFIEHLHYDADQYFDAVGLTDELAEAGS